MTFCLSNVQNTNTVYKLKNTIWEKLKINNVFNPTKKFNLIFVHQIKININVKQSK